MNEYFSDERNIRLLAVENELNNFKFDNVQLGALLAKYRTKLYFYEEPNRNNFKLLLVFIKFNILGFFQKRIPFGKNKILFSKLANRPHLNSLINPLVNYFNSHACVYIHDAKKQTCLSPKITRVSITSLFLIIKFIKKHFISIHKTFQLNNIEINKYYLMFLIYEQLTAFYNWKYFLRNSFVKIIVVDFDREKKSSPLVLAAKSLKIHTITLVHGVMDPIVPFYPLIADEILCWGQYQKDRLINVGVPRNKIHVVGSPIANKLFSDKKINTGNSVGVLKIGIGLNAFDSSINEKFIEYILTQTKEMNLYFLVKLHPSMDIEEWMVNIRTDNIRFLRNTDIDNYTFFKDIHVIIVMDSGIGYEALVNDIPVWVYRIKDNFFGHDDLMIEKGNCPDISNEQILRNELIKLFDNDYIKDLLSKERKFLDDKFYYAIGESAIQNIISIINNRLKLNA